MKTNYLPKITYKARKLRKKSTPEEKLLWKELRKLNFDFRRQHFINGFYVDFYCKQTELVIELDGQHHANKEQKEYDEFRPEQLEALNLKVLRFWNSEIRSNLEKVISKISSYCEKNH